MNQTTHSLFSREEKLNKFSPNTGTCYGKNIKSLIPGFASQFQDSYFYANFIQFLLVALMYYKAGKGNYWKILFYASIAGCCGGLLENITVAYICRLNQKNNNGIVIPFFIDEFFWASEQYAVPLLNVTKMITYSKNKEGKFIKYLILFFSFPFLIIRFCIGYERMMRGYLFDEKINTLHGFAFGIIAITDFICSVSIIYYVNKNKKENFMNSNTIHHIKSSSYTIILCIDIVEFFLSIFDIFANTGIIEDVIPASVVTPLQCLMSNFILILAVDILLFQYNTISDSSNIINSKNSSTKNKNSITDITTTEKDSKLSSDDNYNNNTIVSSHHYSIDVNNNSSNDNNNIN
eukprot:jgi/Orpsp1_1/1189083/evm.model.d7180000069385.1